MEARDQQLFVHQCQRRGAYGEVYRATLQTPGGLEQEVALHLLGANDSLTPDQLIGLIGGVRQMASLVHRHLVRPHGVYEVSGRQGIISDWADGESLESVLCSRKPPGARACLQIASSVASALAGAHGAGHRHEALVPANILLSRMGEVRLLHMGTNWCSISGEPTLAYQAPEVVCGLELAPETDVYALGCILFEALVGVRLMDSGEVGALCQDEGAFTAFLEQRLSVLANLVSEPVADLVGDMLAHAPKERPADHALVELCDALQSEMREHSLVHWAQQYPFEAPQVAGSLENQMVVPRPVIKPASRDEAPATFNFVGGETMNARPDVGRAIRQAARDARVQFSHGTSAPSRPGPPRASTAISPFDSVDEDEIGLSSAKTMLFQGVPDLVKRKQHNEIAELSTSPTVQYTPEQLQDAKHRKAHEAPPKMPRDVYDVLPDELKARVSPDQVAVEPAVSLEEGARAAGRSWSTTLLYVGAGASLVVAVVLGALLGAAIVVFVVSVL